ncbi:MAG: hypothetical protein WCP68_17330 [Enhydrobacter sp.]
MSGAFAIWVEVADFREVAKALRVICSGWTAPMVIQVKAGRLSFAAGSATFNIPCECAQEFSATASVGAIRRLMKLPEPLPKLDGRIMLAARPMDKKIATEWAVAKVKFQ